MSEGLTPPHDVKKIKVQPHTAGCQLLVARGSTNSLFLPWMGFRTAVSQAEKTWIVAIKIQRLSVGNNFSPLHSKKLLYFNWS